MSETKQSWVDSILVYKDIRMLRILLLGAISGFPWVLIASSLSLWLKEEGLSRSTIGWAGLIFGVYAFNYLWAPIIDRIQILYLFILNQLKKIIYPKGIFIIKYDQGSVDDKFIASIISFIYFYFVIFFALAALLSLTGLDFITAISGAATSISNVGPGLGPIIGPNGDFSALPDISKWILTIGMILGRLELFAILVLFLPSFWRN